MRQLVVCAGEQGVDQRRHREVACARMRAEQTW
jgi:hypothetical protein